MTVTSWHALRQSPDLTTLCHCTIYLHGSGWENCSGMSLNVCRDRFKDVMPPDATLCCAVNDALDGCKPSGTVHCTVHVLTVAVGLV